MDNPGKVCALCGCDCTSRPRIKDAKGRYYCRECYEGARGKASSSSHPASAKRSSMAPAAPQESNPDESADLMQALLHAEKKGQPAAQEAACPGCGETMGGGVICMSCGYDTRSGKRLAMQVHAAPVAAATAGDADSAAGSSKKLAVLGGLLGTASPVIFGVAGGLVGAIIWAVIAYGLDREFGMIALLVGVLAGLGVAMGGGSGSRAGVLAAVIAVAAICVGKVIAMNHVVGVVTQKAAVAGFTQQEYQKHKQAAADFAQVKDKSEYPRFMVDHGFGGADQVEDLTPHALAVFESETASELQRFQSEQPTYEQWKTQMSGKFSQFVKSRMSWGVLLRKSLGILDILFFFLAIGAAYRIPAGSS